METIEYIFFRALSALAQALSFRGAGRVGSFLGHAVFALTGFRKSITLDNLRRAFPEKSEDEIRAIALAAYRNYGIALVEMLWSWGASQDVLLRTVRPRDAEVATRAFERGKGLLILSAHFGSWELSLSAVRLHFGHPFTAIIQHQRNGRIDSLIDRHRRRFENITVPMGPSVREVMKALQQGKPVLILGDQSGPKEAVFVPFFGRPSATHRGVAAFSLRTGSPIVLMLLVRQDDGTYEAVYEEVDRSGLTGHDEASILELTKRHVALLERYIRQYPDQWLWMHKRWKHTGYYETQAAEHPPHVPVND